MIRSKEEVSENQDSTMDQGNIPQYMDAIRVVKVGVINHDILVGN